MAVRTLVVVNPKSRNGVTGRRWPAFQARLREGLGDCEVEQTRGPRDAVRIAREAVRSGIERIVVVGGDGTASEVVSGILEADQPARAELALLPFGTGGDLPRTLGVPRDPDAALAAIASGKIRRLDAGRLRYRDREGRHASTYFLNVASLGLGGLVDELVNAAPKALGGTASFLIGTVRAIARYRSPQVRLSLDGRALFSGRLSLAAAANGRFFGGGMEIAPDAVPDDGLLDVIVIPHMPKARLLTQLPKLYSGRHLGVSGVLHARGRSLEAEAEPGAVWLDIDGEPLGSLPAAIEVLPGAIAFVGGS